MDVIKIGKNYAGPLSLLVVVILIAAIFMQAPAIKRQLNAWKLLPQPERLTELYYENHTHLPTKYIPGTAQSFRFTVHNLEYRTTAYNYTVSEQSEDGTQHQDLASGSFGLPQNGYKTMAAAVTPVDLGARAQISTTLHVAGDSDESVHYWVTKSPAEGA